MSVARQVMDRLDRLQQTRSLVRIWRRYAAATMIPKQVYLDNLRLLATACSNAKLADGEFVECGTWRGGMSGAMLELGGPSRRYSFFDSFAGLPQASPVDGEAALEWQANPGGDTYYDNCTATRAEFEATIALAGVPADNIRIHEGLFDQTAPRAKIGKIAVLRLDGDWYDSTMTCLQAFWDKVMPGGLIVIDDYDVWDGCTRAVHDFLSQRAAPEALRRYGASAVAYLVKRSDAGQLR